MPYLDVREVEAGVALTFVQMTIGAIEAERVAPDKGVSFVQTVRGNMDFDPIPALCRVEQPRGRDTTSQCVAVSIASVVC